MYAEDEFSAGGGNRLAQPYRLFRPLRRCGSAVEMKICAAPVSLRCRRPVPVPAVNGGKAVSLVKQARIHIERAVVFRVFRAERLVPDLYVVNISEIAHIEFPSAARAKGRAVLKRMRNANYAAGCSHGFHLFVYIVRIGVAPVNKIVRAQHKHMAEIGRPFNAL